MASPAPSAIAPAGCGGHVGGAQYANRGGWGKSTRFIDSGRRRARLTPRPFPRVRRVPSQTISALSASPPDGSFDDDVSTSAIAVAASDGEPSLEAFLSRFPSETGEKVTVDAIAAVYDFPLDGFQKEATAALVRGDSVVVSAPTGSGKTLVGETAIMTALARGQKAIYTTPLKALSNQKLREFQALFGVRRVGLKTGDVDINTADADVVVMTTEILRNMLYPQATGDEGTDPTSAGATIGEFGGVSDGRLDDVGVVVLDEVHYLSDASRGTVWEETIIYCPPRVQLLCLSATVGNPDDLAGWIEEVHCAGASSQRCQTIVSDYRPVPLNWHFSMRPGRMWPGLGPLLNRNGTKLNYELFPFTKEGAREWAAANGGAGFNQWGEYDDSDDGEYEGGFFRKKSAQEFPKFDGGRKGGAGGGRGKFRGSTRGRGNDARGNRGGDRGGGRYGSRGRSFGGSAPPSPATDRQARRRLVPHVETTVGQLVAASMLPAVWFIFSRKGCDQAAFYLADCGAKLVTPKEEAQIAAALEEFEKSNPDAMRPEAVIPLLMGIASHHAGLLPGWKGLVENLFQRGLLKVVFATETLAAGVNMPARCSVLSALSKRGDEGPRMLTSNEFMQMCGRAGRRGYDTVGHVVCCQSPFEGCEEAFGLVTAPPENLKSQFSISYGMVLNLLRAGRPLSSVRSIVERSFGNYLGGRARREQVRELRRIREQSDALREQIATGDCGVEPEEWARFIKLDERLKEERRLLKIISRQTDDAMAEMARANVRDALEVLGGAVVVGIDVRRSSEMSSREEFTTANRAIKAAQIQAEKESPTVALMPDGSWSMSSAAREVDNDDNVASNLDEIFSDDDDTAGDDDDDDSGDTVPVARSKVDLTPVAVVEAYDSTGVASAMYPLGEFVGLAADGTWYRFDASRIKAVSENPVLHADQDGGEWTAPPTPTPGSLRWVRASGGLWRAQGNEEAVEAARQVSIALSSEAINSADDSEADALAFLDEQRARIAATKAELHEMKMFSDMRRAVKKTNRKREKLKKLEERAKKVERRVEEYQAAGWDEFTRVVDILIEEGALEDPISDDILALIEEECAADDAERAERQQRRSSSRSVVDELLEWEPDDPSPGTKFSFEGLDKLEDLHERGDAAGFGYERPLVTSAAPGIDFAAERRRRDARRLARWDVKHGGSDRAEETLRLTPLGECCAKLRGENELWLGVALSSECLEGLDPTQIAGVAGALCCDSNRPTSCDYDPSPALGNALADLEPEMAEVMALQFEAAMSSPVNMSRAVAALVESWASGATWDQVRGDTNLEEGDIARVFRRTSELLAQMPRARELPLATRKAAEQAAQLVLRPPITDLS